MRSYNDGLQMVEAHLSGMNAMSRKKWPPIKEVAGYRIVQDLPYQGFDGVGPGPKHPWWSEPRFWCRAITVERVVDGLRATGRGPQADAYADAVKAIEGGTR